MDRVHQAIQGLYCAAAGLEEWPVALQRVADLTQSWFAQFVGADLTSGRVAFSVQSPDAPIDGVLDYVRDYHRIDPHTNYCIGRPVGEVYNGSRIVPARYINEHPFYRDFFMPHGARYTIGTKISHDEQLLSYWGMVRKPDQPPYSAEDEETLAVLSQHLAAALRIARRISAIQTHAGIGRTLLQQSDRPSYLVDAMRNLLYANDAGRRELDRGRLLVVRGRTLACLDHDSDVTLLARIDALGLSAGRTEDASPSRTALPIRDHQTQRIIPACLWALRPDGTLGAFGEQTVALLTLGTAATANQPDPIILAAMFNLTPGEAKVAASLCSGDSIAEIARRLSLSVETIRYYVKGLSRKTGHRGLRELVPALRESANF